MTVHELTRHELEAEERRYWGEADRDALGVQFNAVDLLRAELPEPRYIVDGIVLDGLTILAAPPKAGKSWLTLGIAVAVASGGRALGSVPVEQGQVLVGAFEDPPRRLQDRLRQVLDGGAPHCNLEFRTSLPRLDQGGLEELEAWRASRSDARLLIVDTFATVRPLSNGKRQVYDEDYGALEGLLQIARAGVAVVVVHHTRKSEADDPLDTVNGSHGLTGAADAVLVLKRDRGRMDAALHVTGRDVAERELALKFAPDLGQWSLLPGDASEYRRSRERTEVLDLLRKNGPMAPKAVATVLRRPHEGTKKLLQRMFDAGELRNEEGRYSASPEGTSPASPESPGGTAGTPGTPVLGDVA